MGDYISIGFVFRKEKLNLKESILKYLMDSFHFGDFSVLNCRTKIADDGKPAYEESFLYRDITENFYQLMTSDNYSIILFMSNFLGIANQMVNLIYYKEDRFFGFMINLFIDPFRKKINYVAQEELIIDYIKDCFKSVPFDYAICEPDGEIAFAPDEINDEELSYSLLIIPEGGELQVKKGEYLVDGSIR